MNSAVIIDYGLGNVRSVANALNAMDVKAELSNYPSTILQAPGIILPGVGTFSHGMKQLQEFGLVDVIQEFADTGKPVLGICLGMQLLFTSGDEGTAANGIGLIDGRVVSMKALNSDISRLPHVGWNKLLRPIQASWDDAILHDINEGEEMYFVHSYQVIPANSANTIAEAEYEGHRFSALIRNKNVYGCQFHPEKSGAKGLKMIKNFLEL